MRKGTSMYYNDRPDVIESNDITKLLHVSTSHLADGRVILHADFELDPARKEYAAPDTLRMHFTDGVTHSILTPESTSADWREPTNDDHTSSEVQDLTNAGTNANTSSETDVETPTTSEGALEAGETLDDRRARVSRAAETEQSDEAGATEESDENTSI